MKSDDFASIVYFKILFHLMGFVFNTSPWEGKTHLKQVKHRSEGGKLQFRCTCRWILNDLRSPKPINTGPNSIKDVGLQGIGTARDKAMDASDVLYDVMYRPWFWISFLLQALNRMPPTGESFLTISRDLGTKIYNMFFIRRQLQGDHVDRIRLLYKEYCKLLSKEGKVRLTWASHTISNILGNRQNWG